ncbi:OmpA family protein [Marinibactrum halimedae]|uniref:OmpA-like domain-containing protein n=1 Tax=Marinibactrum halimedae TaxID=1444977 RepID=A0AA37T819_9GAMM|nr:OmpA family protein [Marinibactrum halimedae]MCD9460285.1 OmpA family protein [Marinibactrum halimedae]GLS24372.1 hypothetical protein GCM10007877_00830 [Marinibactrum halimedae]
MHFQFALLTFGIIFLPVKGYSASIIKSVIGLYPESVEVNFSENPHDDYTFPLSVNTYDEIEKFDSLPLAGSRSVGVYEAKGEINSTTVFKSLVSGMEEVGVEKKMSCDHDACGYFFVRQFIASYAYEAYYASSFNEFNNLNGRNIHIYSGVYREVDQEIYIVLTVAKSDYSEYVQYAFDLLEPKKIKTKALVLTTEGMTKDIENTGKVVLDGLFFEANSIKLADKSQEALVTISEYLKANPKKRFLVVGHTDTDGAYEYNCKLSEGRAKSVKRTLVESFNIASNRLKSVGISFASPMTSNASEKGRQLNRRVELVEVSL